MSFILLKSNSVFYVTSFFCVWVVKLGQLFKLMGKCCHDQRNSETKILPTRIVYDNSHGRGRKGLRWCGFAALFNFKLGIAVLQNQAVCDILKFSDNFNMVCGFLMLFYAVFTRNSVRFYSIRTPLTFPSSWLLIVFSSNKTVINKEETIHHFHIDHNAPCLTPKTLHNHCLGYLLRRL